MNLTHEGKIAQHALNNLYAQGKIGPMEYAIRLQAIEKTYIQKDNKNDSMDNTK